MYIEQLTDSDYQFSRGEIIDIPTIPVGWRREPYDGKLFASKIYPGGGTTDMIIIACEVNGATHYEALPNVYDRSICFASPNLYDCVAWCDKWGPVINLVVSEIREHRKAKHKEAEGKRKKGWRK